MFLCRLLPLCCSAQMTQGVPQMMKPDTCGFCGLRGRCESSIRTASRKAEVAISTCTYAPRSVHRRNPQDVNLRMTYARKVSAKNPCTNLPLRCELCQGEKYVWKYCMQAHVDSLHGGNTGVQHGGSAEFRSRFSIDDCERSRVLALLKKLPREGHGPSTPRKKRKTKTALQQTAREQSPRSCPNPSEDEAQGNSRDIRI